MKPPYTGIEEHNKNAVTITIDGKDHITQTEDSFFIKIEKSKCCRYFRGNGELAQGYIKQVSFHNLLFIEQMDYRFYVPVSKWYHTQVPFIKIFCLDSSKILNQDICSGESSINGGIYICKNMGIQGNLVFSPNTPVRGLRIIIFDEFYNHYMRQRFPDDDLRFNALSQFDNKNYTCPELQLVFSQINQGMKLGIESELYYESKAAEILFLISEKYSSVINQNNERILKQGDLHRVNEAKRMIDTYISNPLKISELSNLVHVSAAKLQVDFQTAFGCTIHEYVQKARMKEALHKIETTDEPLKKIAKNVGCKNPGRFSAIFKDTFGITPSEYRNSRQKQR
jgi:AraC-like DNA-binding protein